MYGTIIVEPADSSYWPRVDRELAITLDDLLIEDGMVAPFSRSGPTLHRHGPIRKRPARQRRGALRGERRHSARSSDSIS